MKQRKDRLDQLIETARAGDASAYRAFLVEAAGRLRSFVHHRLNSACEVEDVVQDCLLAMHQKIGTLDANRPVAPWMYAIARYKLADHWRKAERTPTTTDDLPEIAVQPDDGASRDLAVLFAALPPAQAEAIRLTQLEGMTGPEASRREGIGLSALKLRVHRGMKTLRKIVANDR